MKMRGYSVLFVCALCVFVLCGAAAVVVVAQDVTPEKMAAEEARTVADALKEGLSTLLRDYKYFEDMVDFVAGDLTSAIEDIVASSTTADTLSLEGQTPSKEDIKKKIGKLETAANASKDLVERLRVADFVGLNDPIEVSKLTNKMREVEDKMREAEQATAAVTDEIPTIDAVIEKAGELKIATEEARDLWDGAVRDLIRQFSGLGAAFAAINATKKEIERATKMFEKNTSPQTKTLNTQLTDVVTDRLTPSLETLSQLKSVLQTVNDAAGEAKIKNRALSAAAEELKRKAQERKQKLQTPPPTGPSGGAPPPTGGPSGGAPPLTGGPSGGVQTPGGASEGGQTPGGASEGGQTPGGLPTSVAGQVQEKLLAAGAVRPGSTSLEETGDYSAGPFCSLTLPVFFFCWCVLFGM